MSETIAIIIQVTLPLLLLVAFAHGVAKPAFKEWRKHQQFMELLDQAEAASELMKTAKDQDQLEARYQRVQEILEHARNIRNK